jgi:hypothetical protein
MRYNCAITSSPFLNHVFVSDWIAARSSTPPIATDHLLYIRLPKTLNQYKLSLKMATEMFVETLDSLQHSTRLIPENQSRKNCGWGDKMCGILISVSTRTLNGS